MPNTVFYIKSSPFYLLITYVFVFLLISPEIATYECKNAIEICLFNIIPVLFPFMVISELIITTGLADLISKASGALFSKVYKTSKISQISFLCGTLFGFPLGAKSAVSLYENGYIEKDEAERLICFCSNTGPGFVIGVVGSCFHNKTIALIIYFSQILSAMIIGLLLRKKNYSPTQKTNLDTPKTTYTSPLLCLPKAITNSVTPMLNVCAFVCFFSVIKGSVNEILDLCTSNSYSSAFITGFLEITNGLSSLSVLNTSAITIALAAFFIGFSGLSVCMQTVSLTSKSGIKTAKFWGSKLLQGGLCAVFSVIICKYLKLY